MSLLCPEGDTDRPTPIAAPKSQRSVAAQQLWPGERLGETEMGTLAEQNKNIMVQQYVWEQQKAHILRKRMLVCCIGRCWADSPSQVKCVYSSACVDRAHSSSH